MVKNPIPPGFVSASIYKPADEKFASGQNHMFFGARVSALVATLGGEKASAVFGVIRFATCPKAFVDLIEAASDKMNVHGHGIHRAVRFTDLLPRTYFTCCLRFVCPEKRMFEKTRGSSVIEFGEQIQGVSYIDRPGAYALIQNGSNAIAVVKTHQGYLLPGGGVEPNEDIKVALQREIMEELGYQSTVEENVCSAVQYLYSESERAYFKKVGHFFKVKLTEKVSEPIEMDHELVWCSFEESLQMLAQEFQAWAVRQAFK